ncbi:hypothetical protein HMPREF0322_02998 [Desulfitobacterium hafniense DP7]|uniref:Uncharacterized protein n=1 Tax=Desulfitobacterium hafniense DP7 TaxID=537010 RepID=G9XPV2_DESHA|nr:hypothetical protein HMPREF0322_02998 [Desulfitobacterium hafniense DP7]
MRPECLLQLKYNRQRDRQKTNGWRAGDDPILQPSAISACHGVDE